MITHHPQVMVQQLQQAQPHILSHSRSLFLIPRKDFNSIHTSIQIIIFYYIINKLLVQFDLNRHPDRLCIYVVLPKQFYNFYCLLPLSLIYIVMSHLVCDIVVSPAKKINCNNYKQLFHQKCIPNHDLIPHKNIQICKKYNLVKVKLKSI